MEKSNRYLIYSAGAIRGECSYMDSINLPAIVDNIQIPNVKIESRSEKTFYSKYRLEKNGFEKIPNEVFKRDFQWLKNSDAVIAEVSGESTGTGWEICLSQNNLEKPVLCLFNNKVNPPISVVGNTQRNLYYVSYSKLSDLEEIIREFLKILVKTENNNKLREELTKWFNEYDKYNNKKVTQDIHNEYYLLHLINTHKFSFFIALSPLNKSHKTQLTKTIQNLKTKNVFKEYNIKLEKLKLEGTKIQCFKEIKKICGNAVSSIFDASGASTDIGWEICYAQRKGRFNVATYYHESKISYMILGNIEAAKHFSKSPPILSTHRRSFNDLLGIEEYSDYSYLEDFLTNYFRQFFDNLKMNMGEKSIFRNMQSFFGYDNPNLVSPFEKIKEYRLDVGNKESFKNFLIKFLIYQKRWKSLTKNGLIGTFINGEREKIIITLPRHDRAPTPKSIFDSEKYIIGYEERALAKNIRGFKDINLLKRIPNHIPDNNPISYPLSSFAEKNGQTRLNDLEKRRKKTFVSNRIILSDYAYMLSGFLSNYGSNFLRTMISDDSLLDVTSCYIGKDLDDNDFIRNVIKENKELDEKLDFWIDNFYAENITT